MKLGVLRSAGDGRMLFSCPGCHEVHQVQTGEGPGPRWSFNGNFDQPTFTPSVLVSWSEPSDVPDEFEDTTKDKKMICHSFVTDGRIQFLSDCTHLLAGRTIPLKPF